MRVTLLAAASASVGCGDFTGPFNHGFDETPREANLPIRDLADKREPWPSLSSVPQRPERYSTPQERQKLLEELRTDRAQGQLLLNQSLEASKPGSQSAGPPGITPSGRASENSEL